jgi:hypothetical protein
MYSNLHNVTRITAMTVLQVDPNFLWATWDSATPVDNNDVGSSKTPVAEEVLNHVRSPFHEMRMAAANYIGTLFCHLSGASFSAGHLVWQNRMFEKLCVSIMSSFTVEVQYAQIILFLMLCQFSSSSFRTIGGYTIKLKYDSAICLSFYSFTHQCIQHCMY